MAIPDESEIDTSKLDLTDAVRKRIDKGREHRERVPLESHAKVGSIAKKHDALAILAKQDELRVAPLVPIRHYRMNASPFHFFRGAAAIMANDVLPSADSGLHAQLSGDAHLANFGMFYGADRRLVFDVDDFDETLRGPFEWDLKRLVTSVVIAAQCNELTDKQARAATHAALDRYHRVMGATLNLSPLDANYARVDVDTLLELEETLRKGSQKTIYKAVHKDSVRALRKLTTVVDGQPQIISKPPLIVPFHDGPIMITEDEAKAFFDRYKDSLAPELRAVIDRYRVVDIAHKVVGIGSVGTRCLIALLECDQGAPLFLQLKEASTSVWYQDPDQDIVDNAGREVVRGQRAMQSTGDILLGWSHRDSPDGTRRCFYVRQLWDGKGGFEVDQMGPKRLRGYASACGAALALAHARTGDGPAICGYLGDDQTSIEVFTSFAESYAKINAKDFERHSAAIASGEISVSDGL